MIRNKYTGCSLNVMRQSACLVINPIAVNKVDVLLNCTPVGPALDNAGPDIKLFILVCWGRSF